MSVLGFSDMAARGFQNEILNNFLEVLLYQLRPRIPCISCDQKDLGLMSQQPLGSVIAISSAALGNPPAAYNC